MEVFGWNRIGWRYWSSRWWYHIHDVARAWAFSLTRVAASVVGSAVSHPVEDTGAVVRYRSSTSDLHIRAILALASPSIAMVTTRLIGHRRVLPVKRYSCTRVMDLADELDGQAISKMDFVISGS